jgi:AcrR family transcriptional regulator
MKRNSVPTVYGTLFRLSNGVVVSLKAANLKARAGVRARADRPVRADAQRNLDALLEAAMAVFATSGVDAPVRQIAEQAGVGLGTVYRHFPQRSDLIAAVFRHEIDACAGAAPVLAIEYRPGEALAKWMLRYVDFVSAKRGLAPALHSGDPAFETLRGYFDQRLRPALHTLLASAVAAGEVRADVDADDILSAVTSLSMHAFAQGPEHARRMVSLFVDGLRYIPGANSKPNKAKRRASRVMPRKNS